MSWGIIGMTSDNFHLLGSTRAKSLQIRSVSTLIKTVYRTNCKINLAYLSVGLYVAYNVAEFKHLS